MVKEKRVSKGTRDAISAVLLLLGLCLAAVVSDAATGNEVNASSPPISRELSGSLSVSNGHPCTLPVASS